MRIDSRLLQLDPAGCGCTNCLTGVYKPVDRATDDDIQALFLGLLTDCTYETWEITQTDDNQFSVTASDKTWTLAKIAFPITVERYDLDLDLDLDTVVENLVHVR